MSIVFAAKSAARAALCLLVESARGFLIPADSDSPISTKRRIASDSDGLSGWSSAHLTTEARITGDARKPISGSFPVAGLPRLLGSTFIDFAII
ncbi:hypothetical protein [Bradyrhizobium sp. AZCC 1578]|uniref:hypothetical protein n=1 Tax=Bradyrhizobium sp. AZCC 1578 TaxID=3117027 RepID=UPI002FEE7677